jgi:hypothetical protein
LIADATPFALVLTYYSIDRLKYLQTIRHTTPKNPLPHPSKEYGRGDSGGKGCVAC